MKVKHMVIAASICLFIIPSFPVSAATSDSPLSENGRYAEKNEVVYALLHTDGEQQDMYVVNSFAIEKPGKIIDYGSYSKVKNLTNVHPIEQNGGQIAFTATDEPFYYQGDIENKALPWDFHLSYKLNDEAVSPADIIGQNGSFELQIEIRQNDEADQLFFENYMLQITIPFDSAIFKEIKAEDGMISNAGQYKQVTFTVMPGQEKTIVVNANVTGFEMESIEIAAMPPSMFIEKPNTDDVKEDMQSLSDATATLHDGVHVFKKGIAELSDGLNNLQNGSSDYWKGIQTLDERSTELIEGSESINEALQSISQSLNENASQMDLSQLQDLQNGLTQMAKGLEDIQNGLTELKDGHHQAFLSLDQAIQAIPGRQMTESEIEKLKTSNADPQVVDLLLEHYHAAKSVKVTYDQVQQAFQSVSPTIDAVIGSLGEIQTNLEKIADLDSMAMQESMKQLTEGLTELSANYQSFHDGIIDYTTGVSELSNAYGDIHGGISDISDGMNDLEEGAGELQDGTAELADSTADLPEQLQEEIDNMIKEYDKSNFDPVSFVSPKNEDVASVQFVIKTDSIKQEEQDEQPLTQSEGEKSFWQRLVDLFR